MKDYVPSEFHLSQNYPNPFRDKTTIKYCVAFRTRVRLTVYNSEGKVIIDLVDEDKREGTYEVLFDSVIEGRKLASGNYPYRLAAGFYSNEKVMLLEK